MEHVNVPVVGQQGKNHDGEQEMPREGDTAGDAVQPRSVPTNEGEQQHDRDGGGDDHSQSGIRG